MNQGTTRMRIISVAVVLFYLLVIWKLFDLQVVNGNSFRERADDQYVTPTSSLFERGVIYFSDKEGGLISAATQRSGYKVAITPNKIINAEALYEKINSLMPINYEDFIARASKTTDPYEEILSQIDKESADKLKTELGENIQIYKEKWRYYPGEDLASHTIGFMGYKGDEYAGRYGLESSYENILARNDSGLYVNFFAEVFSDIKALVSGNEFEGDIITSIEPTVQLQLENSLIDISEKWSAYRVSALIMNPQDGSIYAMASYPDFDINNFRMSNPEFFKNPLVENVYEPGSIFKPIILSIALDQNVVAADTPFYDPGFVVVGDHTIYNFDKKGRGNIDIQEVLNQSLNTGMVFVMGKLEKDTVREYFKDFGFADRTGIDLPGEVGGLVSNLSSNRNIEFANMSFGQGIAISPISMARALAIIANGGLKITPHVVKEIVYTSGLSKKINYPVNEEDRVISKETSGEISRMLTQIVDTSFREGRDKMEDYSIAAKTGTAQIPMPGGGYYEDRRLHSFFGYFPAYDPQFLVLFYLEEPKGVRYASETLFDPFLDTAKFLINYYNVPPDR